MNTPSPTSSSFSEYGVPDEPRPIVMILSGPSGVGKDSALDALEALGVRFHRVVTATSRAPRPNEVDGRDYHFVSLTRFAEMIDNDELLEYALVYGDYKGVPKSEILDPLARGEDVIMRIDVQGAATMAKKLRGAITVFLTTSTEEELIQRLHERKMDSEEQIAIRIAYARKELAELRKFKYAVINRHDKLEETAKVLWAIMTAEKARTDYRRVELA
ncbi:MAG: guanylate kinase [Chloroflexi bacterium]|nr:guanylate kinase [Chloroflexota bacterium]